MLKEYLFRITKEQYLRVVAENEQDAYEIAEENSYLKVDDEDIINVELIDAIEKDEDYIYDTLRLEELEDDFYE